MAYRHYDGVGEVTVRSKRGRVPLARAIWDDEPRDWLSRGQAG